MGPCFSTFPVNGVSLIFHFVVLITKDLYVDINAQSPGILRVLVQLIVSVVRYLEVERNICIGNSMICSDIWHKYHEWYFEIVIHNLTSR